MKDLVLGVVSQNFRPEFINRIDEVVVFHPLGEKTYCLYCPDPAAASV
ncbi:protein disaggregation chaperone [Klebsiella pneumoniae]|nr:protein disaggregation chaperone [Klebsiella pneumoniae]